MREDEIIKKAGKCVSCVIKPCQMGCPLRNDTTGFIKYIKEGKYKKAYELLCETTVLQAICGRICPHEKQCQGSCVKKISYEAVKIGDMEAFLGDMAIENDWKISSCNIKKNKTVAVIGAGPAGLSCAAFLAKNGYNVTIYEKYNYLGGILVHGIPEFRLSKDIVKKSIDKILELGIEVKTNFELGKDITLNELEERYDAVFLGIGANISSKMRIDGEDLKGVYGGNELLEKNNHPNYEGKNVIVSGGGNVAMDTARIINKKGAKSVTVVYRRAREQMPAEAKEVKEAMEEGVKFLFTTNILKILGKESVQKIECIKTELVKKEGEDRLSPVNVNGSNFYLDADYVVMAVGSKPEDKVVNSLNLELNSRGRINVGKDNRTSVEKVFAGGDIAGALQTVAGAAASGRNAAYNIMEYLEK